MVGYFSDRFLNMVIHSVIYRLQASPTLWLLISLSNPIFSYSSFTAGYVLFGLYCLPSFFWISNLKVTMGLVIINNCGKTMGVPYPQIWYKKFKLFCSFRHRCFFEAAIHGQMNKEVSNFMTFILLLDMFFLETTYCTQQSEVLV